MVANCYETILSGRFTQDAALNAGVLSIYLTTILYIHVKLERKPNEQKQLQTG